MERGREGDGEVSTGEKKRAGGTGQRGGRTCRAITSSRLDGAEDTCLIMLAPVESSIYWVGGSTAFRTCREEKGKTSSV